jgi:hypothetical protein
MRSLSTPSASTSSIFCSTLPAFLLPSPLLAVLALCLRHDFHDSAPLLYLGLALLGVALALAWVGGRPGGGPAAALLPPLCALLLWWGVGRVEAAARPPSA